MALNCSEVSLTPCKHEVLLWLLCRLQREKNLIDKLYNNFFFFKVFWWHNKCHENTFCTFRVPYLEFEQEILLNREKPVEGEGLYYWTQKLSIIQIQRGGNEHQQAACFNIYPENRNKKKKKSLLPCHLWQAQLPISIQIKHPKLQSGSRI